MLPTIGPVAGPVVALGPSWMDPETLISAFGPYAIVGICLVIFIETGLLFPLLPGDSLLFTAGLLVSQGLIDFNIYLLCALLFVAAFVGDQTGYAIGRYAGPRIFRRPDSRFFKQAYIDQTYAFFDKYGGRALVIGRFVPIVRTYIPVAAGIGHMPYRHFVRYNAIGALVWAVGVTLLGYFLGRAFPAIGENLEIAIVVIVAFSLIPIGVEWYRARRGRDPRYDEQHERDAVQREVIEEG